MVLVSRWPRNSTLVGPPLRYSTLGLRNQMPTCLVVLDQPNADLDIGDEAASRSGAHRLASRDAFHRHLGPPAAPFPPVDRHQVDHGRRTVHIMRPKALPVF